MAQHGPALDLTDEDLERLAEITEQDILTTQQRWARLTDQWATNLLLAESTGGDNA